MIRIFRHYIPKSLVVLGTTEAGILFLSVYLGVGFSWPDLNPTDKLLVGGIWTKAVLYTVLMMAAMTAMGLYQRYLRDALQGILFRAGLALLVGLLMVQIGFAFFPWLSVGDRAFAVAFVVSAAGILVFRALIHLLRGNQLFPRRIVVLGAGKMASQVEELKRKVDLQDVVLLGFVPVPGEDTAVRRDKVIASPSLLLRLVIQHDVDEIVVAYDETESAFPLDQILDCKMHGVRVIDLATFFEEQTGKIKLDALTPRSLVFSEGFIQAVVRGYVHRVLDISLSLIALACFWPLMLLTAAAIVLDSGRPVFFRQRRVGRNGVCFDVLKFRSMTANAEVDGEAQWATKNDDRVTRVGAVIRPLRIDELPQLLNVLAGEMSFVGPRPERPEFVRRLRETIPYYELRHRVNPGITGWAQICYPYGSSEKDAKEKLQFDLYYIKNYSLFLDIMILVQTIQVILWGKGGR